MYGVVTSFALIGKEWWEYNMYKQCFLLVGLEPGGVLDTYTLIGQTIVPEQTNTQLS